MVFYALVSIVVAFIFCNLSKQKNTKKLYCILTAVCLILLSGLRHPAVGETSDTFNYINSFNDAARVSWKTIVNGFFPMYFSPSYDGDLQKDPGFTVFEKVVHYFINTPQLYLILIALLTIVPLSCFIYRNVKDTKSALVAFSYYAFFYFSYITNSSIRQSIALSLILLCYNYLQKDKIVKCLLVLFVASTLHKSVLIFLLFILLHKIKAHKLVYKYAFLLFLLAIFLYQIIVPYMSVLGEIYSGYGESDYYSDNGHSYNFLIFIGLLYFLTLLPVILKKEKEFDIYKMAYLASSFTLFLSPLMLIAPAVLRINVFFAVWNFSLIPHSISLYDKTTERLITMVLLAIFFYMSIGSINEYMFFWQGPTVRF